MCGTPIRVHSGSYHGQMGFEDDYNPSGSVTVVNRYGLGARGLDRIERTENASTTYGYPLYDGHGNMRAVLAKSGTSYTTGNWRTYDVWGSVRSGGSSSDPTQGYCANLGHVADADSGLIYMRARYHEPSTGRFISEDPLLDGINWYGYAANDPTNKADFNGCEVQPLSVLFYALGTGFLAVAFWGFGKLGGFNQAEQVVSNSIRRYVQIPKLSGDVIEVLAGAALLFYTAAAFMESANGRNLASLDFTGLLLSGLLLTAAALTKAGRLASNSVAGVALFAAVSYSFRLLAEIALQEYDRSMGG